jgi:DNA topoisomerase-3
VKVVNERCDKCVNHPRKLKIVFSDEMVNQGFPKEYTKCICGCDHIMNSALKISQRVINMISEAEPKDIPLPPLPSTIRNNNFNNSTTNSFNTYTNNTHNFNFNNNTSSSSNTNYNNSNFNNFNNNSSSSSNTQYNNNNFSNFNNSSSFNINYSYSTNNENNNTSNMINRNTNNFSNGFIKSSNYNSTYNNFNNNRASSSNSNVDTPNCPNCSQPLLELTVTKDNENKGRKFFKCRECDYFKWKDEYLNEKNSSGISNIFKEEFDDMNNLNDNKPRCSCGLVVIGRVVNKEGPNKGRIFFSCRSKCKNCKYFKWADEMNLDKQTIESCMDSAFINHDSSSSTSYKRKRNSNSSTYSATSSSTTTSTYKKKAASTGRRSYKRTKK